MPEAYRLLVAAGGRFAGGRLAGGLAATVVVDTSAVDVAAASEVRVVVCAVTEVRAEAGDRESGTRA